MAGLKMGSRVVQLEGDDPGLIAAFAKVVGLSGHACALASTRSKVDAFERAANAVGVLVEARMGTLDALPYDDEFFDLVAVKNILGDLRQNERVLCLQQARRVLRVGGRCLVIDRAMRGGIGAVFSKRSMDIRYVRSGGAVTALKAEGFRGVRQLADHDGQVYIEGVKAQTDALYGPSAG